MIKNRVGIIGAGPGGLAAAVLLQRKGFEVDLFEASDRVGGRNSRLSLGDFHFDTGPTFFLMPQILEQIFESCGRKMSDFVQLRRIDPMYRLDFGSGGDLQVTGDRRLMSESLAKFSRKDADRFFLFRERQRRKFEALFPALQNRHFSWTDLVKIKNLAAIPFLDRASLYDELRDSFEDERVRLAFTFQAKYLGMSPFDCPSLFTILSHIEHELGVWHPVGGCHRVSEALAELFVELGGRLHLNSRVSRCLTTSKPLGRGQVDALEIEGLGRKEFDFYVMNADFAHGMGQLFSNDDRKKYNDEKLERLKYSCSTFMLYLGLNQKVPLQHHSIYFAQNYRKNVRELSESHVVSQDPSFYVHNPVHVDPSMAPQGKSGLYVLVPVANLDSGTDWDAYKGTYRKWILQKIRERSGIDLEPMIEAEHVITPRDWQRDYGVYKGATFSLAHSLDQMLHLRPQNQSEDFTNFYLVGGGTHPGSGLPTILVSARIASDLIQERRLESQGRGLWPLRSPKLQPLESAP